MELTAERIEALDKLSWPDDLKQDFAVKVLEGTLDAEPNNLTEFKRWANKCLLHMHMNETRKETNRKRLESENADSIAKELFDRQLHLGEDPSDVLEMEDSIGTLLDSLSALNRATLIEYYVEGRTPEDIAAANGENVEAVRKRITRARNQLKGE